MSESAAIAVGCLVLALGSTIYALRCLADHLLPTAAVYTFIAIALVAEAAKAALDAV